MRIALIDADSIGYVLGWIHRDMVPAAYTYMDLPDREHIDIMGAAVDSMIRGILDAVRADSYLVAIGKDKSFRHEVYKYAPYKGKRKAKEHWYTYWEHVITARLKKEWHAVSMTKMEADDIVSFTAEYIAKLRPSDTYIICSPDKDLRQIPGEYYDFKKMEGGNIGQLQAAYNFWYQMLIGDDVDCISGVPGIGPKKATEILKGMTDSIAMSRIVAEKYTTYFGEYYGPIIQHETRCAVELLCGSHPMYVHYKEALIESFQTFNYKRDTDLQSSWLGVKS